jgi:hypothetical protein
MPASDRNQVLDEYAPKLNHLQNMINFFNRGIAEETKLVLTPEMIRAEFLEAHLDTTMNAKQE